LTGPSTSIPLAPTSPSPPSQPASRTASPVPAPLVCTPINSTPIPESIVPTPAPIESIPVVAPRVSPAVTSRPSTPAPPTPNLVPFVPNVVPPHDISSLQAQIQEMPDHSQRSYDAALREFEWGPEWAQCLAVFVGFERAAGFVEYDTRLPTSSSRPVEIKNWFGASRKTSGSVWDALGTGESAGFGKRWWQWWEDIQPGGRIRDESGGTLSRPADIDWEPLFKPGASGVHLVLVGLVWWKQRLIAADESWLHAVADVTWVLECLLAVAGSQLPKQVRQKRK
jgi:hypothetical protein